MVKKAAVKKSTPSTIQQMEDVMKAYRIPAGSPVGAAIIDMSNHFDRMERIVTTGIQEFADRVDAMESTVGAMAKNEWERRQPDVGYAVPVNQYGQTIRYEGQSDGCGHVSHGPSKSPAIQGMLSVPMVIGDLQCQIDNLEKATSLLIDRLTPVLGDSSLKASKPTDPRTSSISVISQIGDQTERISLIYGRVLDALDRLQL